MAGEDINTSKYYDMARKQQYTDLMDAEISLENARANAIKNTSNQLANSGMLGTGYGSSINAGIDNAYANAYAGLKAQTEKNLADINLQESQANETSNENSFRTLSTLISSASNEDNLNNLLSNYGYGAYDEKGQFSLNENLPENMSNEDWAQLQYLYNEQIRNIQENTSPNYAIYSNFDELSASSYADSNGHYGATLGKTFEQELRTMWANATFGTYNDGDLIQLKANNGDYAYFEYTSKGFRPLTNEQFKERQESKGEDTNIYTFTHKDGNFKNGQSI